MPVLRSAVLGVVLAASAAWGENWPQWRGPFHNGSTTETGLPDRFSPTENVKWATPLPGPSGATPIVWDARVFVSSTDPASHGLLALCLDAATGRVLWSRPTGRDRQVANNNMASASPIADGASQTAYFFYGTGQLFAFSFDGQLRWQRDLERDHGHNALMFGYSSSPLLFDGRLYVIAIRNRRQDRYGTGPAGQTDSYLLALDPATGKDIWKRVRTDGAVDEAQEAYSTAVPCEHGGRPALLVLGADALTAHDPASGEEVWRWEGYNPTRISHWRIVPSPVVAGGVAFVPGPKHSCGFAVRLGGQGKLGPDAVAWTFPKLTPDASTPLAYRGRLYVLDDDTKVLTCLDPKAGKAEWQGRLGTQAVLRASLTGADGKLYTISERHEALVLAADRFEVLHRVKMGERGLSRSTIAAAQGRLFLRTAEKLYCIGR